MNKVKLITILTMTLMVTSFSIQGKDMLFRPLFQKELKRLKTQQLGSLQKLAATTVQPKEEVFIDLNRLYWGHIEDLTTGFEDEQTEPLTQIASGLRADLKGFAKRFGYKLCWHKDRCLARKLPDVTQAFLEYWDNDKQQDCPLRTVATQEIKQEKRR